MSTTLHTLDSIPRQFSAPTGRSGKLTTPFLWTLRLLCAVALGVTGYLAYTALQAGEVAGCSAGSTFDCSHVLHSRWAKLFNVPVSIPAFGLYFTLLCALFVCRSKPGNAKSSAAWSVVTIGSIAAGLAAAWFVGLQTLAIGKLCAYCLVAHTCGILLCVAVLWKRPLGGRATAMLSTISVLGVSLLIGGQVFAKPPETFKIERFDDVAEPVAAATPVANPSVAKVASVPAPEVAPAPAANGEPEVFEPF